jgi:predicted Rossmann fold flavoprotein
MANQMTEPLTVVIGGGAAGMCAAISQGRCGRPVVICEKTSRLGKKVLATGNGRCNLLNDDLSETHYNANARSLVRSVFARFGKSEIVAFFKSLGLELYSQEGRVFPVTNQAASVLKVLEMELARLSVPVEYDFDCAGISSSRDGIVVSSRAGKSIACRRVIIAGGGKTYPAFGSDGSAYEIGVGIGHSLVPPIPSAVPLVVKDNLCHHLQGQRIFAAARSLVGRVEGRPIRGELLFTKYGLSGTCILDISDEISTAINRLGRTDVFVSVDLVPFMDRVQLKRELARRQRQHWPAESMLAGILPNKVAAALSGLFEVGELAAAVDSLKDRRFRVAGTMGWNEAEFTSGGISVDEVHHETLASRIRPNVYFAGEILDVNGQRGGYNLAWAWASGFVAGETT